VEENIAPTRRSTRTAAKAKAPIIDDDYVDGDFDSDTDDYDGSSPKPKIKPKPKAVRGKASRPAYGHFRSVADIDFDSCSDEETVPLRAHRDDCEKCRRAPTNILLGEYMKKKSKQKSKKKNKDEFEEEDDDREKLANLGGWVRW
jgi:chromodomain-helicase-DNA-binding protein 4